MQSEAVLLSPTTAARMPRVSGPKVLTAVDMAKENPRAANREPYGILPNRMTKSDHTNRAGRRVAGFPRNLEAHWLQQNPLVGI